MSKRWFSLALVVLVAAFAAIGAAVRGDQADAKSQAIGACLVTDTGGLNDKSFNALAYKGLNQAKARGVTGRVITSKSAADYIPNLQACVRAGAKVTIGVGFLMADAIDAIASRFPQSKFAVVDVDVTGLKHKPKNVQGLLFKEQEAGYLVGYAAGLWTKLHPIDGQQVVGSVGGVKIPPVDRYIAGYQFGAKKANPQIKVVNDYSQDFNVQAKCKEKALNMIANGAGVIFQVAGGCGLGALDAAKEKAAFGIGVDADQSFLGPHVLTSALKRVDSAVFLTIESVVDGSWTGGRNEVFGLDQDGVALGTFSDDVDAKAREGVEEARTKIVDGEIGDIPTTVG